MKRIAAASAVLLILLVMVGFGAVFPGGVAGDADLLVASNSATSTLNGAINNSVTTFVLVSGARFVSNQAVTIDSEIIFCTTLSTNTFSGCSRGYNGTTPAAHSNGATVSGFLIAAHHNALASEIKAIEGILRGASPGVNLALSIRAGSAQSGVDMWQNLTNGGVVQSGIGDVGQYFIQISGTRKAELYPGAPNGAVVLANQTPIYWKNNTASNAGTADIGICRNNAGVLEVDDANCTGTLRDLLLRNLSLGIAGTGAYAVDVGRSGTNGTAQFYDQTPSTGVTFVQLRAGAGQSTTELTKYLNNSNTIMSFVNANGAFGTYSSAKVKNLVDSGAFDQASDTVHKWLNADDINGAGSYDTGVGRNAAGVVEFNSGTLGTYRDAKLRTLKRSVLTVATLPGTPADGDEVWISDSADGSCATGSGSIRVQCIYNGTSWIAH